MSLHARAPTHDLGERLALSSFVLERSDRSSSILDGSVLPELELSIQLRGRHP
jgi:hypothetical protein